MSTTGRVSTHYETSERTAAPSCYTHRPVPVRGRMSAFAVTLDELIASLDQAASRDDSLRADPARRHLDRATIRLERAYAALKLAGTRAPAQLLVRLRGRAQELEAALGEAEVQASTRTTLLARKVVDQIDHHLAEATASEERSPDDGTGHSRTPSADLPRRVPAQSAEVSGPSEQSAPARHPRAPSLGPGQGDDAAAIVARRAKALSDCFFLHRLATGQVLANTSLSTVLRATFAARQSAEPAGSDPTNGVCVGSATLATDLEDRIRSQLRRAYFDSFRQAFKASDSDLDPDAFASITLSDQRQPAWNRLARDLVDATTGLIPSRLRTDRSLYPSSSDGSTMRAAVEQDLTSEQLPSDRAHFETACLGKMTRLARVLQRLCSPARDAQVWTLLDSLEPPAPTSGASAVSLVDLVERVLDLAEAMRGDLDRFKSAASEHMVDAMSEADLQEIIKQEAAELERATVTEWCGGEEGVRWSLRAWIRRDFLTPATSSSEARPVPSPEPTRVDFIGALVDSLFSTRSVALTDLGRLVTNPSELSRPAAEATAAEPVASTARDDNPLPPALVVLAPLLFELQNLLQALGILAAIATLLVSTVGPAEGSHGLDRLFRRLWTILEQNISCAPSHSAERRSDSEVDDASTFEHADSTRLANLADELVSYLSQPTNGRTPPQLATMERVRSGVDRILRYEDPVWKLLMRRLRDGAQAALLRATAEENRRPNGATPSASVPSALRTGQMARSRPAPAANEYERPSPLISPIKGFDHPPFLAAKVEEVLQTKLLVGVYRHVEQVWGDVFRWPGSGEEAAMPV